MKALKLLIPLLILCCTTASINVNMGALTSVKNIAIVPFTSTIILDRRITDEAEETFRGILANMNYNVIGREGIESLLQRKEFSDTGITKDNLAEAGKILGADAFLFGEITAHNEEKRIITHLGRNGFGMLAFDDDQDSTEVRIYYRFKIILTLVNAKDGSVILSMTNRYIEAEHDDYMPGYLDLDSYRRLTLKKMGTELTEAISGKP